MSAARGLRIGRYRLLSRLERRDSRLIESQWLAQSGDELVVVQRFARLRDIDASLVAKQVRASARLSHRCILRVHDFVRDGGEFALVVEHVPGTSLAEARELLRCQGETFGDEAALWVGACLATALAVLHREGLAHGDVTPKSLHMGWDGVPRLSDIGFGLLRGRVATPVGPPSSARPLSPSSTGRFAAYAAPEVIHGGLPDERADVYAAALIVRELLVGGPAFAREGEGDEVRVESVDLRRLARIDTLRRGFPARASDALERALEPDASRRTITAEELASALSASIDPMRGRSRLVAKLESVRQFLGEEPTASGPRDASLVTIPPIPMADEPARFERTTNQKRRVAVTAAVAALGIAAALVAVYAPAGPQAEARQETNVRMKARGIRIPSMRSTQPEVWLQSGVDEKAASTANTKGPSSTSP